MGTKRRHRRPLLPALCVAIVAAALVAAGCGGDDDDSDPTVTTSGGSSTAAAAAGPSTDDPVALDCKKVEAAKSKPADYGAPPQTVKKGEKLTAVVKTSCGSFEIQLDTKRSPTTVNSFVFLAEKGFYDGLTFDEAAEGTYLHGGDPPGKATGPGYTVKGEVPEGIIYRRGVIAMAESGKAQPPLSGSQFFISVADPWIDMSGIYPPIGRVEKGLKVLEGISEFGPQAPDTPYNTGVIGPVGKLDRIVTIEDVSIAKG
ncbi:MAG TPA: peptidylprolyl isomerase [Solirubrobacterales bacterium]